jgi:CRP-like cAMP-binding protein
LIAVFLWGFDTNAADFLGYFTHLRFAEILGYIAAFLVFMTFSMKTMVPLRTVGIASNVFFIAYGYLNPAYPLLVLHLALLPLNILRLNQMLSLVRQVENATQGDLDMNWIKPFTSTMTMTPGEVIFRKGDEAKEIIFVMSGSLTIPELGIAIPPGEVVGELAMLSPEKVRTQSAVCVDGGQLLIITYDQVRQLFFQNPKFGYFFMQLSAKRLFENMNRMQTEIETLRAEALRDSYRPTAP